MWAFAGIAVAQADSALVANAAWGLAALLALAAGTTLRRKPA
ncbi:MAG: hypothetical protein WD751_10305 [Anaerolineales bacterium]